eukprot:1161226-Pelagomonas_calceolata.AAC.3
MLKGFQTTSLTFLVPISSFVTASQQICDEILSHHPLDEDCLHPLKLVLRNLHRLQDITRIYEAAHAAHPNDEGTAIDLFASYVR